MRNYVNEGHRIFTLIPFSQSQNMIFLLVFSIHCARKCLLDIYSFIRIMFNDESSVFFIIFILWWCVGVGRGENPAAFILEKKKFPFRPS